MNLTQVKLAKSEWDTIEVPISSSEMEISNLIKSGYSNVNIKYNGHNSLFTFLKIPVSDAMTDYLFNTYFGEKINKLNKLYSESLNIASVFKLSVKSKPQVKKADLIRIEQNDMTKLNSSVVYEYLLIDILNQLLSCKMKNNNTWQIHYFTLSKLCKNDILYLNSHINNIIHNILDIFEADIDISYFVENPYDFIEKNTLLLKYEDMKLYDHQKQLFTLVKNPNPKLILYIAPTGTGKTLSPIGISEQYKVIFVCAARHVGLALAKFAISSNKKIAFAFGCGSSGDIRLHYFAVKDFIVKRNRHGDIIYKKVDNSVGDKVEIMICDVKSYIPAMHYMLAFNDKENIITYFDEPTITMDYESHPLHETINRNWRENLIPNIILSSATLPKLHEINETLADFKCRFDGGEVFNIISNDCKKSIPILNNNGYVVLPHYLSEDYAEILRIVEHCNNNLTLLRYFDLSEVIKFIMFVENNEHIHKNAKIERHFGTLNDINMQNIKTHYLRVLGKILPDRWSIVYNELKRLQSKRLISNETVDLKGAEIPMRDRKEAVDNGSSSIYITTKDAYTLTDGPTIFLATDVEKVARFYINQADIPEHVMDYIMKKIESNNIYNKQITELEHKLEDLLESKNSKDICTDSSKEANSLLKQSSIKNKGLSDNDKDIKICKINTDLDALRVLIKPAKLNETFIPNTHLHLQKWASEVSIDTSKAFTCEISEKNIVDIMTLSDISNSWKILLLMGIGVFAQHTSIAYMEIMKSLADQQKLYLIIASSDYIYGTNYQFCHGYLSKDLVLTQEKMIQALGRIGRGNIQQNYTIRLRDNAQITKLFWEEMDKPEVKNMNILFSSQVITATVLP